MNVELQTIAPIDVELGVKLVSFNETDNMPILKKYICLCVWCQNMRLWSRPMNSYLGDRIFYGKKMAHCNQVVVIINEVSANSIYIFFNRLSKL